MTNIKGTEVYLMPDNTIIGVWIRRDIKSRE